MPDESDQAEYPTIGRSRPSFGRLPRPRGLTRIESPSNSATTGSPLPAPTPENSIGPPRFGSGAVGMPTAPAALATETARLFGLPAAEARLALLLARALVWSERSVFGEAGYEGVAVRDVAASASLHDSERAWAAREIERICEPGGASLAAKKLAELRSLTAHGRKNDDDAELMAAAYIARLAAYPADVIVAACDAWADRETFWPAWADLKAECDKRVRGRLQIRRAFERQEGRAA